MASQYFKGTECIITTDVETTKGTWDSAARDRLYAPGVTFNYGGRIDASPPVAGIRRVLGQSKNARWADLTIPACPLVYGLFDFKFEDILCATFPSALTLTDILTINPAGTHIDGTTGCTIVLGTGASASDLNAFTIYNGATASGAAGMMMEMSGWADASNNVPARIKDCNDTQIDIMPPYSTTGATIAVMGALKISEVDKAAVTLKIGAGIRDSAISGHRSRNVEVDTGTTGNKFRGILGQVANTLPLSVPGNANAMIGPAAYLGIDYEPAYAATKGNGTITANAAITNPILSGSSNFLFGSVNGVNHFAGTSQTAWGCTLNGGTTATPDVSGSAIRKDVRPGIFTVSGHTLSYLDDPALTLALQTLERATGDAANFPVDVKLYDGTNYYWFGVLNCALNMGASSFEGDWVSGQAAFESSQYSEVAGTFVVQKFAA